MLVFDWFLTKNRKNIKSIIQLAEENGHIIREDYFSLIENIGNHSFKEKPLHSYLKYDKNNSLWTMSKLFEKSNYKSIYIGDVIKVLAFKSYLDLNKPKKIYFKSLNKDIFKIINSICYDEKIEILVGSISNSKTKKNHYKYLPSFFRALTWLTRIFLLESPLRIIKKKKLIPLKSDLFICSYFSHLNIKDNFSGEFNSGIWGELPNLLKRNNIKSNWIHHYIKSKVTPSFFKAQRIINQINSISTDCHSLIKSHLNLKLFLKVVFNYLTYRLRIFNIRLSSENFFLFKGINFNFFYKEDFKDSFFGITAIQNILWIELFDKILKDTQNQKLGIYLQENQGWEFAFINAWKKNKHGKLVAIQHSSVSFWDLRYKNVFENRYLNLYNIYRPDFFAVNGSNSKKKFLGFGYHISDMIELESLRYTNNSLKTTDDNSSNILVLGDISSSNTLLLLDQIYPLLEHEYNFTFKSHPANPIELNKKYLGDIKKTELPLNEILSLNSYVISTSDSSSGVESYLAGKRTLIFNTPGNLNRSPLSGESSVFFVSDSNEILTVLQKEFSPAPNIKFFNNSKDLMKWKKLLLN
tara:strand:- start:7465 stop:9210 length:1746 start_codon:yes stop_codon:yes gene_type:complete